MRIIMADRLGVLLLVPFLLLFHVISAAVLGSAVRPFRHGQDQRSQHGCRLAFTAVWATLFGGIPFVFGVVFATSEGGTWWLIPTQVVVWVGTFLAVVLAEETLRSLMEPLTHPDIALMLFGGVFLVSGIAVLAFASGGSRLGSLCAGGALFLVGSGMFGIGLWQMLRATR